MSTLKKKKRRRRRKKKSRKKTMKSKVKMKMKRKTSYTQMFRTQVSHMKTAMARTWTWRYHVPQWCKRH